MEGIKLYALHGDLQIDRSGARNNLIEMRSGLLPWVGVITSSQERMTLLKMLQ